MRAKLIGFVITTSVLILIGAIHITSASKQGKPALSLGIASYNLTIKERVKRQKQSEANKLFCLRVLNVMQKLAA